MAKVAICTPHGGTVPPEHHRYEQAMQNSWLQHQWYMADIDMMLVGKARNDLVRAARSTDAEVFWFIDDDILVPPDAGKLVGEALELGVVSGLYIGRRQPYTPQMYRIANEPEYQGPNPLYWPIMEYPEGLMAVDAVGNGCLCVRRDIFDELEAHAQKKQAQAEVWASLIRLGLSKADLTDEQKWTMEQAIQGMTVPTHKLSPWFEFLDEKGEDLYFCEKVRELGRQVWIDTTVKCLHMGYMPVAEQHFLYLKNSGILQKMGPDGKAVALVPQSTATGGNGHVDQAAAVVVTAQEAPK